MQIVILNWRDRRHPGAGAAELYCERAARELAGQGHRVTLVTSRPRGLPAREAVDGYQIRRLGGRVSVYPLALLWLVRHRRSLNGVLDSANGIPFFSPLVVRRSTPVVLCVHHVHHGAFAEALHPAAARFARWLEGPATRAVYGKRTVIVLSPSVRVEVRRRLSLRGAVRVVPGGVDTSAVVARRAPAPRIVVVGRLTRYERLVTLVRAVSLVGHQVPGVELHLVGDGTERGLLEQLAAQLQAPVTFHGRLQDAERDAVLSTAWLTVSASDGGDWSLAFLEANAMGVPALARRVRGMRDSVRHGESGWLVDETAGDPVEALASAVVGVLGELTDPRVAAERSGRARSWAARFSWERTADGVLAALSSEAMRRAVTRTGADRRAGNDISVVIDLPRSALPADFDLRVGASRTGDWWTVEAGRARALLVGADESDALALLRRLDIDAARPDVRVVVARHADVVDLVRSELIDDR